MVFSSSVLLSTFASAERTADGKVPSPRWEPMNFSLILPGILARRWLTLGIKRKLEGFGTQPDIRDLPDTSLVIP
jgi:hypothetical protein